MASPEASSTSDASEHGGFRSWPALLGRWLLRRRSARDLPSGPAVPVARFRNICISREAGAGGGTIARLVGTRLDWKVYDHEIIEAIAHRMEVPAEEVRALDELAPRVLPEWRVGHAEETYAPPEDYTHHATE